MSRSPTLNAGAASVSITPPLGVDLMGFLRRSEPARGYAQPMEANALVLDDGDTRLVLIASGWRPVPWRFGSGTSCMTEACQSFVSVPVTPILR